MLHVLGGGDAAAGDADRIAGLAQLKKKVARLSEGGKKALAVPLPEPVRGRLERGEAYKIASEEVSAKWAGVVARNRKKDVLDFTKGNAETVGRNTGVVAEGFKPIKEYEKEIQRMLRDGGVGSDVQVVRNEEKDFQDQLGVAGVSKEELLERRRELAKVRSLMFHYERKMKRIKKIKSRKYRRILKKEKEKLTEGRMGDHVEDAEDQRMKKERERAEERMTLRHKNTSKWVRRQLQRKETKRNPETRAAVEEQLQLHEDLKRRQEGMMDDSDDSDSDNSEGGEHATEEQLDAEMEQVRQSLNEEKKPGSKATKRKGLMGMKFMQVADERQRLQARALLDQINMEGSDEEEADGQTVASSRGRQSFSGGAVEETAKAVGTSTEGNLSDEEKVVSDDEDDARALKRRVVKEYEESEKSARPGMGGGLVGGAERLSEALMEATKTKAGFTTILDGKLKATTASDNPWLRMQTKGSGGDREVAQVGSDTIGDESDEGNVDMASSDGKEEAIKTTSGQETSKEVGNAKDEALWQKSKKKRNRRETGTKPTMTVVDSKQENRVKNENDEEAKTKHRKDKKVHFKRDDSEDENEGGSDWEDDDVARMKLVAKAFSGAGGADEEDFAAMKEGEVGRSLPKAADVGAEVLPGWGSWDGAGMKKRRKKGRAESAFARAARERLDAARSKAVSARADRDLSHVILDERRIKQATQLTLASVPFPFTSVAQWQREVAAPVCRELVTARAFEEQVAGRIKKKAGVGIKPISLSSGRAAVLQERKRKIEARSARRKGL
ncbi:unnamed protein product [Chondrus crispus]|uniref:Uncharacterized protein n=1 Tax=Chondrus crispus TaxID=2769 RepID=R7QEI5_CHOCR|nr:unnamed protein product [Chondrus crispus]CDF35866.1 unnamed protein product [Chondrus crispus]|eukprot:XP_005715685.1 unnamed protein product [Chondrus crispus]